MNQTAFCNKCGQQVPAGSRFCNGCGATLAPQPRVEMMEEERVLFTLRPTMIFVYMWYALAVAIVIAAAALMGIINRDDKISGTAALYIIAGVGLAAFIIPVYKHILRLREVYTLTSFKLEMRYGIIAKNVRNIPLNKIQDVTVTSSVWQRFLNLGDIVIDSASEAGKIHLDDIHHPGRYADQILNELRRWN